MNIKRFLTIFAAVAVLLVCSSTYAASASIGADPAALPPEGGSTLLILSITNDSSAVMENIVITTGGARFFTTDGLTIDPGASTTLTQSVSIPSALLGQPVVFDIAWYENGEQKTSSATLTVLNISGAAVENPLSVSMSASSSHASRGEIVTLTYTITNAGFYSVSGVSLTDKEIAGREPMAKNITVDPGVPYVFTYEYTMGTSTVVSAPVVSYSKTDGTSTTVQGEEKTLGMVNSRIKTEIQQGEAGESGQPFTIVLTNDGNQRINKIKVTDELGNAVSDDVFSLAIGESTTLTYTVPTDEMRNVVFYITGTDAMNTSYSDHTETYVVRKYIDPSLIGIEFGVEVASPLDNAGSITLNFFVDNTGTLDMCNLTLSEKDYGVLYMLEQLPKGKQTINQKMSVGEPRDLSFVLQLEDPSGNVYSYTAHVKADIVGIEPPEDFTPVAPAEKEDILMDVGNSISSTLRVVLVVLVILTVIAGIALIILDHQEKEERKRIARRRAQRERMMRAQLEEDARRQAALRKGQSADGATMRIPPVQNNEADPNDGNTRIG